MSAYAMSVNWSLPPIVGNKNESGTYRMPINNGFERSANLNLSNNSQTTNNDETSQTRSKYTVKNTPEISVKSASVDAYALVRTYSRGNNTKSSSSSSTKNNSSAEDAIQFDLMITFNGRKYTAKRSLPSFMKLRDDIVNEIILKKSKSRMRKHDNYQNASNCGGLLYEEESVIPDLPAGITALCNTGTQPNNYNTGGRGPVLKLPSGTSGRGFTMVQAVLRSYYCPAIERWLHSVSELAPVDSSPAFTQFLWEPLGDNPEDISEGKGSRNTDQPCEERSSLTRRKSSGSLTLWEIDEGTHEE